MASMGYQLNEKESTAQYVMMEKGKDKLLIEKPPDGHWIYRSTTDPQDRGTIVGVHEKREAMQLGRLVSSRASIWIWRLYKSPSAQRSNEGDSQGSH